MKNIFKKIKKENQDEVAKENSSETDIVNLESNSEMQEEAKEFNSFFNEVLKKLPQKTSIAVMGAFDKSKLQAEKILTSSKEQYESVFDEFLEGVDVEVRKKAYSTIHAATLTAAIIGCSPIPFSDAVLLVPVQLTMMARLHKMFGQSWSENLGAAFYKELVVVGFGRSVVGNMLKMVPAVGTVAGAAINGTVASAITATLGWITVKMLNDGEDIFENVMSFKGQFNTLLKAVQKSNKTKN